MTQKTADNIKTQNSPTFIIEDLDYIFIREQDKNGNWNSFSLNEITDEQFINWVKTKGLKKIEDAPDVIGTPWTKQQKIDLLNYLDEHGVIINMIRREKRADFDKMGEEYNKERNNK